MNSNKANVQQDFFGEGFFDWQGSSAAVADKSKDWHYDENKYWGGFARGICRDPIYTPYFLGPFIKYKKSPVFAPAADSWDCGHIGGGVHNGSAVQKDGKIFYIYRGEMPHKLVEVEGGFGGDGTDIVTVSYTHLTLPTNSRV